jgi:hypothetical protein
MLGAIARAILLGQIATTVQPKLKNVIESL